MFLLLCSCLPPFAHISIVALNWLFFLNSIVIYRTQAKHDCNDPSDSSKNDPPTQTPGSNDSTSSEESSKPEIQPSLVLPDPLQLLVNVFVAMFFLYEVVIFYIRHFMYEEVIYPFSFKKASGGWIKNCSIDMNFNNWSLWLFTCSAIHMHQISYQELLKSDSIIYSLETFAIPPGSFRALA
jgi:hypothetical protein